MYASLNWYTKRFPFPHRGWKFVRPLLQRLQLSQHRYTKRLFSGDLLRVNATDHIQQQVFWYGCYEPAVSRCWLRFIDEKSWVMDIGANIGYFSVLAAGKATKGQVLAFEPAAALRQLFLDNVALNGFTNVQLLPFGISNRQGSAELFLAGEDNTGRTSLVAPGNFSGSQQTIQLTSLDAWLNEHPLPRLDLLKIDVEGSEMLALDGMRKTLRRFRPVVFIEVINQLLSAFGHSAADVFSFFDTEAYQGYRVNNNGTLARLTKPTDIYDAVFLPCEHPLAKTF